MNYSPVKVAVIGLGGFAGSHHRALLDLEKTGVCRLIATCDPFPENFIEAREKWRFAERGVRVFDDYLKMLDALAGELDVVTVPTPVHLHAPMHQAIIERGLACYLEKPPTLYWRELEEMLAIEERARKATQVGFNFIVESARQKLKQRILDGEFGALQRVSFLGHWPRNVSYYQRAPWAGRIRLDGRLVLDSPIGNAMAHYIHNLLFWAGTRQMFDWAGVTDMTAEISRAHAIENYDTVLARGMLDSGAEFRIAATHASKGQQYHYEVVHCELATITYYTSAEWHIEWKDGQRESGQADRGDLVARNFDEYFRYLRGETSRPLTRLEDSKPFVHLTNLVYAAAGQIDTEEEQYVTRDGEWVAVRDIVDIMETFIAYPFEHQSAPESTAVSVVELENVLDKIAD